MSKVDEIATKETSLNAELSTALEAAKVLTPATPEFDEAYSRYLSAKAMLAKLPDELAAAKLSDNKEAIDVCGTQVATGITQLIDGLKVADLTGTPITALRYFTDAEGKHSVVFNPVTVVKAKGTGTARTPGSGRTVIVDSAGERLSLTKFVLAHATEAEKLTPEYKYPHSQVATKPKFEAFCAAHSLTGFTYETAPATTPEAS